jgi:hypothetical protein
MSVSCKVDTQNTVIPWTPAFAGAVAINNVMILTGLNATSLLVEIDNTLITSGGVGPYRTIFARFKDTGGTTTDVMVTALNNRISGPQSALIAVPPGQATVFLNCQSPNPQPPQEQLTKFRGTLYCNGNVPGQTQQPCQPDPWSLATLQAILDLVTIIQRQHVPFAYIASTAHSGISGNGQFAVSGLVGLAVNITTLPSRVGGISGDPTQIWDVGWINTGTADGWGPRHFISANPFLLQPVSGDVTLVGYSIPEDVVVSIVELVREP